LAEASGLIVPLGEWVLRQACTDAAGWSRPVNVAVNLSPVQFKHRTLVQSVITAIAASGLPPERLEVEITESVLLQDSEATLATLHTLRDFGVRVSMDDFGTGYSSLSYLARRIRISVCEVFSDASEMTDGARRVPQVHRPNFFQVSATSLSSAK
jgi:EAL domain-containing protein (putative c-di-GMP-specific phosphodiesterase class I)